MSARKQDSRLRENCARMRGVQLDDVRCDGARTETLRSWHQALARYGREALRRTLALEGLKR